MATTPAVPVEAARPLSAVLDSAGVILVYHPAYRLPTVLLRLACASKSIQSVAAPAPIIANNARGYLTLYEDETEIRLRGETPGDLLRPGKYHYRVPSHTDGPYPICMNFRAWKPPVVTPQNWAREHWAPPGTDSTALDDVASTVAWSGLSYDVKRTDGRCAMTGDRTRLSASHLIPQAESTWVHYEIARRISIDNAHNVITLRADLKRATFDEGHFVLFPYQGKVVTIFMTRGTRDLARDFHFRAAEIPGRIFADYLHARFAWSIFKIIAPYVRPWEKNADIAKVAVPATLRPKPKPKPSQRKKRKRERSGGAADADEEGGLDVYCLTDADIARTLNFSAKHASPAAPTEGDHCYPGYSKVLRLAHEYRRQHPEVSAVRTAQIPRVGEEEE
ncbi:hypothetical protein B0H12DRAFT_1234436 [Mycena haematopus]|nr:hypothetical protein B0H12DRAFT_1234436 [Mycena haematopus]